MNAGFDIMDLNFNFAKVCRYIALTFLILGTVGSFILASEFGVTYGTSSYYVTEERNWVLTIAILLIGLLGSACTSCIFWFFSEVIIKLDNLKK